MINAFPGYTGLLMKPPRWLNKLPPSHSTPDFLTMTPGQVNHFINSLVTYRTEPVDHWQSYDETVLSQQGDCEDFAIAKLDMLTNRGYTAALVLGFDTVARQHHAVCIVQDRGDKWYVLDTPGAPSGDLPTCEAYLCAFTPQYAINRAGEFCIYGTIANNEKV